MTDIEQDLQLPDPFHPNSKAMTRLANLDQQTRFMALRWLARYERGRWEILEQGWSLTKTLARMIEAGEQLEAVGVMTVGPIRERIERRFSGPDLNGDMLVLEFREIEKADRLGRKRRVLKDHLYELNPED